MTMLQIDGAHFEEQTPKRGGDLLSACPQCAFGGESRMRLCAAAVAAAPGVFGGDCCDRGVIYKRVAVRVERESESAGSTC